MLPGQASQTLLIASIMRARHQLFDAPVVLDDPVVLKLVPEAQDPGVLTEFRESRASMASLMRSMFAVRSKFTEDRLARAAARGVRQYVMFGAGLNTFPWRQPDFAKDMQIFAVDHPASSIQTNQVFRQRRFARPPNLVRVPLDLEQRRIEEQLTACDFDRNTASFCSSLGLMLYLEDEIVDDILRFVVSLPPPSEVVFSFVPPDEDLNGIDLEIARRAAAKFATIGEPWKSRVGPRAMVGERVKGLGFGEVFHLSPELAQARIFFWPTRQVNRAAFRANDRSDRFGLTHGRPTAYEESPPVATNDDPMIHQLINELVDAWNRGDAKAYGRRYLDDTTFTNVNGMFHVSREEFDQRHDEIFRGAVKGSTIHTDTKDKFCYIRPDVAIVDLDCGVFGTKVQPPGVQPGAPRLAAHIPASSARQGRRLVVDSRLP